MYSQRTPNFLQSCHLFCSNFLLDLFAAYQFNVFAFELEADLRHGESVEVPSELRAGVLDCVLSDLLLLEEVRAVGVALVGFLVDVEALKKARDGQYRSALIGLFMFFPSWQNLQLFQNSSFLTKWFN